MKIRDAVQQWRRLEGLSRKPSTQTYHEEIREAVLNRWINHDQETSSVTVAELETFVERVAHFSATRYNAIINCIKSFIPAAAQLRTRMVTAKERHNLSQPQFSGLLDELDQRPRSHSGLVVRFLSVTGLRIGAARKLKWTDVRDGYILAPAGVQKNSKPCMIPFVSGTMEILERLKKVTGDSEFILPQASVKTALYKSCDRLGIPRLSHHDFRHLFATRCIESGVDLPTAARWLGHQDGGALLGKTYFHLADAHSRKMAALVRI